MISKVKYGFQDEKWYEPLINLGIIDEPEILSDPYYDGEAVVFARDLLDLVTVDNEKEIVRSLLEILSNAKQIEAKAEEIKESNSDLHDFLELHAMKISDNVTKIRKALGIKPLSEYLD